MAKIIPMILIESMSGKVCSHSDTYFARRNGTTYTGTICNHRTSSPTENELAVREKFKKAHAAAVTRHADVTQIAADTLAFSQQSKYKTMLGYLFALEYQKL